MKPWLVGVLVASNLCSMGAWWAMRPAQAEPLPELKDFPKFAPTEPPRVDPYRRGWDEGRASAAEECRQAMSGSCALFVEGVRAAVVPASPGAGSLCSTMAQALADKRFGAVRCECRR